MQTQIILMLVFIGLLAWQYFDLLKNNEYAGGHLIAICLVTFFFALYIAQTLLFC